MDTTHAPIPKPRKPGARRRGGQRGNQNARKHGRSSRLNPTDRVAYLRKVLRGYGFKDTTIIGGVPFGALAAESNTHLKLVLALFHTMVQLAQTQAHLADAQDKLRRR